MIPGISSFSAVANKAKISLCEKNQKFCVMEMPDNENELHTKISEFDTVILMKVHKKFQKLIEFVKKESLDTAIMIQKVSLSEEKFFDLKTEKFNDSKAGYMSTAILKKQGIN
jgi:precorrin-2/cobalt-factor-2 C20-methyltransferase